MLIWWPVNTCLLARYSFDLTSGSPFSCWNMTSWVCNTNLVIIAWVNQSHSHTHARMHTKKSQDYVKIGGFYRPSRTRPILTQGIQICSQKWSQVNISIGYGYISQVKILYKVKFSKLEICQSDCRFEILAKNCVKKVSFFFLNFD